MLSVYNDRAHSLLLFESPYPVKDHGSIREGGTKKPCATCHGRKLRKTLHKIKPLGRAESHAPFVKETTLARHKLST
jgi:hypothetical protein